MNTEENLDIHLDIFEGPLDLLLFLIKKNNLDIYDIPIAQITQEYLKYLDVMKELNLDVAGEFLVMNILIAASEVFPFCKTGGLADVAGALAQVLSRTKGNKVTVFLPRYRTISGGAFALKSVPGTFLVPVGDHYETASLSHGVFPVAGKPGC